MPCSLFYKFCEGKQPYKLLPHFTWYSTQREPQPMLSKQPFYLSQLSCCYEGLVHKCSISFLQSHPPLYDLTTMNVPTAIWAGGHDILITPRDVTRILPQIRNLRYFKLIPDWNHFDFVWGLDAAQRMYSKIIALMKEYH